MKCCVKYIISFVTVLTAFCSVLCFSSFAASSVSISENFIDIFTGKYVLVGPGITEGVDYDSHSLPPYNFFSITRKANADGTTSLKYSTFDIRYIWSGPDINAGDMLKYKMRVEVSTDSSFSSNAIGRIWVQYKTLGSYSSWKSAGTVEYVRYSNTVNEYLDVNFSYIFPETPEEVRFSLSLTNPDGKVDFTTVDVLFPSKVTDYYFGSSTGVDAPIYPDYSDELGAPLENYSDVEQELLAGTEQGRDSLISFFASFGKLIDEFALPLLVVSSAITYFVDTHIVYRIILISLTLGLFAYVFNLAPSIVRSFSRSSDRRSGSDKGGG